jgi:peptidoglycan/LPS O-acetylase OafA/YrhL
VEGSIAGTRRTTALPEVAYRADIDGLRAIAVLSVIAFHADPKLAPGGFVGVDIFFVISGFLISSLIVNGLNQGDFSFLEFYRRRIRRLFPALIAVLLATLALGLFVLLPTEFASLGRHTVGAAAFAANVLNYVEDGYFDAPAISKPLLHIWSLGVEEQFYFVFPALLVLIWRKRRGKLVLVLIGIASFVLNIATVRDHSSSAFYLPATRFWEFIAGALLSFAPTAYSKFVERVTLGPLIASWWRDGIAAMGLLLIFAGFALTSTDNFPGWWALLPVLGTVFLIGAGPLTWLNRQIIADSKLVFIGLISYPLYLWHWPLLVMGRTTMDAYNNKYERTTAIVAVALAFVLAWLTFRFIERPARARRPAFAARRITGALFVGLASVALLGFVIVQFDGLPTRYPKEIQALVAAKTFADAYADDLPIDDSKNSIGPLLVTYGDSHAWHLQAGLRRLQTEQTFRLQLLSWRLGCSPMVVTAWKRADEETCRASIAAEHSYLERAKPDIVVIAAHWFAYRQIERISESVRFLQKIGVPRIVVIGPVPTWPRPLRVILYRLYNADPSHRIPERLFDLSKQQTLEADRRLKEITSNLGVNYISTYGVFCNENGCLARLGLGATAKDLVQRDNTHLTPFGSWYLVSRIADQIFH